MAGLLNYTTTIPAAKTISQMQQMLVHGGASSVAIHYDLSRRAAGLTFTAPTKYGPQTFTMPVDITAVQTILAKQRTRGSLADRMAYVGDQAERTAWRVARSWLEAQLALIAIGMVQLDQIMLPFLEVGPGKTLYAAYQDQQDVLALTDGHS